MIRYPKVQAKAQAEIDRVVGTKRLPSFEDQEQLPYINQIMKEVMRWQPVTPLGAWSIVALVQNRRADRRALSSHSGPSYFNSGGCLS